MANPEWVELYDYVHDKIMGYDKTVKLPKYIILRLQGLSKGQFIGNNKLEKLAQYDYKTILLTFKMCRLEIMNMIEKNKTTYKNEQHKFNAIMTIIDREINNVVLRLKNVKKSEEKTVNIELYNQTHDSAEYIPKSKQVKKELEDLW